MDDDVKHIKIKEWIDQGFAAEIIDLAADSPYMKLVMRDRQEVSQQPHKLPCVGAIPAPATILLNNK